MIILCRLLLCLLLAVLCFGLMPETGLSLFPHALLIALSCLAAAFISPLLPGLLGSLSLVLKAAPAKGTNKSNHGKPAARQNKLQGNSGKNQLGKVKWFNVSKGYGFITCDSGEDVFVHFRSVAGANRRALREGQRVSFIKTTGEKGPQAEQVELAQ